VKWHIAGGLNNPASQRQRQQNNIKKPVIEATGNHLPTGDFRKQSGVVLTNRHCNRRATMTRRRMPIDLCKMKRCSLVGDNRHSTAITPKIMCATISKAVNQCKNLAMAPHEFLVLRSINYLWAV